MSHYNHQSFSSEGFNSPKSEHRGYDGVKNGNNHNNPVYIGFQQPPHYTSSQIPIHTQTQEINVYYERPKETKEVKEAASKEVKETVQEKSIPVILSPLRSVVSKKKRSISVVSYNILAPQFTGFAHIYDFCDPKYLDIDYRKNLILKELMDLRADIICLQECDEELYEKWFLPNLKKIGFDGRFKMIKSKQGTATFFTTPRFRLTSETSRNSLILQLLDTYFDNSLLVANLHTVGAPKENAQRLQQVEETISDMKSFTHYQFAIPTIMCGDFNSDNYSGLYKYITGKQITHNTRDQQSEAPYMHYGEKSAKIDFKSAYAELDADLSESFVTDKLQRMIDFIFFTPKTLRVKAVLSTPKDSKANPMPDKYHPSDHIPLFATLTYQKNGKY